LTTATRTATDGQRPSPAGSLHSGGHGRVGSISRLGHASHDGPRAVTTRLADFPSRPARCDATRAPRRPRWPSPDHPAHTLGDSCHPLQHGEETPTVAASQSVVTVA
jgi:hypothetical protein